jgi:signal transduction histidine kinase
MSIATRVRGTVQQACNLLGCAEGYLLLRCDDSALRHPLLNALPAHLSDPIALSGQCHHDHCVLSEAVAALCDICSHTGNIWGIDRVALSDSCRNGSITVAPLTHTLGTLGFLIFLDTHEGTFSQGEGLLLKQFLSLCIQQIIEILEELHCCDKTRKDIRAVEGSPQGELICLVSHELRSPLTAIKGYVELLRAYSLSNGENDQKIGRAGVMTLALQQHYLEVISEQARHLEVLTGDLLDISRLQAGRLTLHCMSIDLVHICQRVARFMRDRVEQQHPGCYEIRCRVLAASMLVWADPNRVQQILTNLIENAVKYSPDGGLIEIMVTSVPAPADGVSQQITTRKAVSVTVRDQGVGIPPQQQYDLFKPFSRIEQPATHSISGSGLGLYISRRLVEAMNGRVTLQSCKGAGTSITFTLPTEP